MIRFGIVAIVGALVPFAVPQYALTVIVAALIFGLFAMSLDLMVGYCRLFSFGHAAAYGLGAYSAGLILIHWKLPLLIARALRHGLVPIEERLLLPGTGLPARLVSPLPRHRALPLRRGARRHPRERGEDGGARLQHARVQDHP